jgi:ureidoglycolate lyase
MASIELHAEALTAEAFAPFGDVIEVSDGNTVIPINYGLTERHHDLANVDVTEQGGKAIVSLFRTDPVSLPFQVKIMERHPLGSQAFMGTGGQPYLVVVAPAGEFEAGALKAFLAGPGQGVNYHRGTWHHYCLSLNAGNVFLVVDRDGEGDNCDEISIPEDLTITITDNE